jgi:hypothetical protein
MDVKLEFNKASEKELYKRLRQLPEEVQGKALVSAAKLALNRLIKAARLNVTQESGTLAKAIQNQIKIYRKGEVLYGLVGINTTYGQTINGKLKIPNLYANKQEILNPYMRPAWESERHNIQKNFEKAIDRKINSYLKKVGKR